MGRLRHLTVLVDEPDPGRFTWTFIEVIDGVGQWQNVDAGGDTFASWDSAWGAAVVAMSQHIADPKVGPRVGPPRTPKDAVTYVAHAFPQLEIRKQATQTSFWVTGMTGNRGRVLRIADDGSVKRAAPALRGAHVRDTKLHLLTDDLVTIVRQELRVLANEADEAALEFIRQMIGANTEVRQYSKGSNY
jgi:hypothetical protein